MKVRFLTDSGSTSNPIEGLLGSDKVDLIIQCCVSSANPKGSIPSNPNQQQNASSKAKKVSTVDRYSVSKQGYEIKQRSIENIRIGCKLRITSYGFSSAPLEPAVPFMTNRSARVILYPFLLWSTYKDRCPKPLICLLFFEGKERRSLTAGIWKLCGGPIYQDWTRLFLVPLLDVCIIVLYPSMPGSHPVFFLVPYLSKAPFSIITLARPRGKRSIHIRECKSFPSIPICYKWAIKCRRCRPLSLFPFWLSVQEEGLRMISTIDIERVTLERVRSSWEFWGSAEVY